MLKPILSVAIAVCLFSYAPLRAEVIVTKDGSSITGNLVGYEGGYYHIQIGSFVKKIHEGQVKEIRDSAASTSSPAVGSTQPEAMPKKAPSGSALNPFSNLFGSGGTTSTPDRPVASGETEKILRDAVRLQKENPMLRNLMGAGGAGGASRVQTLLNSGGNVEELKQLQGNPAMEMFVNRFKDKKFQETFLREIEAMNQDLNPGKKNPHVETLKALFEQLNNAGSMQPAGQ